MAQQENNQPRTILSVNERVLYFLVALTVLTSVASALRNPSGWDAEWLSSWLQNFSTEMMGAFATFILFELIVGRRQTQDTEERAKEDLKQRLIREMRSADNATALNAVEELRELGWLTDGSLEGTNLQGANLQGANLVRANLQMANLSGTKLQAADFGFANLHKAFLKDANLQNANLAVVNLRGAILMHANLQGADLTYAAFDENTQLPDQDIFSQTSYWTPDTDMARFTNPDHPEFWRLEKWWSSAHWADAKDGED